MYQWIYDNYLKFLINFSNVYCNKIVNLQQLATHLTFLFCRLICQWFCNLKSSLTHSNSHFHSQGRTVKIAMRLNLLHEEKKLQREWSLRHERSESDNHSSCNFFSSSDSKFIWEVNCHILSRGYEWNYLRLMCENSVFQHLQVEK